MEIGDGPLPSPVKIILEEFFYQGIFKTFHQRNEKQVPNSDSNTGNTGIGTGKGTFLDQSDSSVSKIVGSDATENRLALYGSPLQFGSTRFRKRETNRRFFVAG